METNTACPFLLHNALSIAFQADSQAEGLFVALSMDPCSHVLTAE